jgi:ABC-type sugar transport system ATPase subunit
MIKLTDVVYRYDRDFVIGDISFELKEGETLAIVGPSGSGKSTLLKLILGSLRPDKGSLIISNINVTDLEIEKRNIGYCPQDQLLFPHLNVFNNIAIGLKAKNTPKTEIKRKIDSLAEMSNILPLLNKKINQLSGGQKQRVSILRALATNPAMLLLDEPLSNLDRQIKDQIINYIKKIQLMTKITIIFVTHDISEAKLLADKVLILINGKMKQFGSFTELSFSPISFDVAQSLGLPNIFEIIGFHKETNHIHLNIGVFSLGEVEYNNEKLVFIDPTAIIITQFNQEIKELNRGIIKSVIKDLITKKQIIEVEIIGITQRTQNTSDIIETLTITTDNFNQVIFEKNFKISFVIPSSSFKLL